MSGSKKTPLLSPCDECDHEKAIKDTLKSLSYGVVWSPWQMLQGCWRGKQIQASPGLYRIRIVTPQRNEVVYIGESDNLKVRLGMLNGVFNEKVMPYRSPHTAGPALWALRDCFPGLQLEASVAQFAGVSERWRKGLECVAIALHRQKFGVSPRVNFTRMPPEYRASSFNTAKLAQQQKRFRGGKTLEFEQSHLPGIGPLGPLAGSPHERLWCGHCWTPWQTVQTGIPYTGRGLYRLSMAAQPWLVYLGWGNVREGVKRQIRRVPAPIPFICSWTQTDHYDHQFEELLTDLIATHCLVTARLPCWQFKSQRGEYTLRNCQPHREAGSSDGKDRPFGNE